MFKELLFYLIGRKKDLRRLMESNPVGFKVHTEAKIGYSEVEKILNFIDEIS